MKMSDFVQRRFGFDDRSFQTVGVCSDIKHKIEHVIRNISLAVRAFSRFVRHKMSSAADLASFKQKNKRYSQRTSLMCRYCLLIRAAAV